MSVEDLQSESWLIADELSKKRGSGIDFSDPNDASLIMRAVNYRNVKRGDWHMRRSVRLDQNDSDDDHSISWSNLIPARDSSDPLISILERESGLDAENILRSSYSQATAYVSLFSTFDFDREEICKHLVVSNDTLLSRLRNAASIVRRQPSLFDRVERIAENFMALQGIHYPTKITNAQSSNQYAWNF